MNPELTLEDLARAVQDWCEQHHVFPANGQAAEQISERTIRYYRTLGLLDPPVGNYAKTFTEKHRLQLIAIRIYQAHGLPLRKIRDELYGKNLDGLAALEKRISKAGSAPFLVSAPLELAENGESWGVTPLAGGFMLISRQNRQIPRSVLEKINQALRPLDPNHKNTADTNRN